MHSVDKAFQIFLEVIYIAVHCRMQSRKKTNVTVKEKKWKKIIHVCMLFIMDVVHVMFIFNINVIIYVLIKRKWIMYMYVNNLRLIKHC